MTVPTYAVSRLRILDAAKNIADSWEGVKITNMNGVRRKLCPLFVNDFHGFEERVDHVIRNIVARVRKSICIWRLMMLQSCWNLMKRSYLLGA